MNKVKVKRVNLLEKVKANRKEHRDLFLQAQEGYRSDVIQELDRMLEDARKGKPIQRYITLPEPQDHTKDYDRVVTMLEMSVEDEIELDSGSFDCYVMDNWSWKQQALTTNSMYAAKLK